MALIDELLKIAADKVISTEKIDPFVAGHRMLTCEACDKMDKKEVRCKICKCYLEVKTKTKTNLNPKKLRYEVTHCPLGRWDDLETANRYRELDGLPPL